MALRKPDKDAMAVIVEQGTGKNGQFLPPLSGCCGALVLVNTQDRRVCREERLRPWSGLADSFGQVPVDFSCQKCNRQLGWQTPQKQRVLDIRTWYLLQDLSAGLRLHYRSNYKFELVGVDYRTHQPDRALGEVLPSELAQMGIASLSAACFAMTAEEKRKLREQLRSAVPELFVNDS